MLRKRTCALVAIAIMLCALPAFAAKKAVKVAPAAKKPTTVAVGEKLPEVAATVNGEKITKEDLVKTIVDWDAPMVLEQLIMQKIVSQEAKKAGIVVTAEQVKAKFDEMKKNLPPGQELNDLLRRGGYTPAHAFSYMKMNLQIEGIVKKQIKVSADELAGYTRASHILIRVAGSADPKEKEKNEGDAKTKIDKIAEEIKGGLAFEEAAKKYSEDPMTKEKGGDLDFFSKGQMYPEFEKGLEALKPGEISAPVKTPVGYHLIKMVGTGKDSTGEDRKKLEDQITNRQMGEKWREFMLTAQNKAKIVNYVEPAKPAPKPTTAPAPKVAPQPRPAGEKVTPPPPPPAPTEGASDAEGAAPPPPPPDNAPSN